MVFRHFFHLCDFTYSLHRFYFPRKFDSEDVEEACYTLEDSRPNNLMKKASSSSSKLVTISKEVTSR
jgi:hypothetical protein